LGEERTRKKYGKTARMTDAVEKGLVIFGEQ